MAERVSSRLRPDGEAMGLAFHRDAFDFSVVGVDDVDDIVVTAGEPELFAVDADVSHVGAATVGDGPGRRDFARGEIND